MSQTGMPDLNGKSIEEVRELIEGWKADRDVLVKSMTQTDIWLNTAGKRCKTIAEKNTRQQMQDSKARDLEHVLRLRQYIRHAVAWCGSGRAKGDYKVDLDFDVDHTVVTEHAVVRWLERAHGLDPVAIKQAIVDDIYEALEHGVPAVPTGHWRGGVKVRVGTLDYVIDPNTKRVLTCYHQDEDQQF